MHLRDAEQKLLPTGASHSPARRQTGVTLTATSEASWTAVCGSMFRHNHIAFILVLFVNSFLIHRTRPSRQILQTSQRGYREMRQTPHAARRRRRLGYVNCDQRSSQASWTLLPYVFHCSETITFHGYMELRLPNSLTSPLFSNVYIGLNINFFLLPTKLIPLFNLLCTAWSLFSPSNCSLLICCHLHLLL